MYLPALWGIVLVVFLQFPGTLRMSGRLSCKYIFPDGHLSFLTLLRGVFGFFSCNAEFSNRGLFSGPCILSCSEKLMFDSNTVWG